MLAQQEDNTEGEDQSLDVGLSFASSNSSMNNMSVGGDSLKLSPKRPLPKHISQPQAHLPDIERDAALLDINNNEEDEIISDETYLLSRKEQLKKQLKDEEARAKSMRNRLMHASQCEDDIDGNGGLLGFGTTCKTSVDDNIGNDTIGETDSSSNNNNNTDVDSDARSSHSITAAEESHPIVDELDQAEEVHPPIVDELDQAEEVHPSIVDVLDKNEESHPPIVDVFDKSAQQPHSIKTTTSRGLNEKKAMSQSFRTMKVQASSIITVEKEYVYEEEQFSFY